MRNAKCFNFHPLQAIFFTVTSKRSRTSIRDNRLPSAVYHLPPDCILFSVWDGDSAARVSLRAPIRRLSDMAFFKITLLRSAIGLPKKSSGVLQALGLRKRMRTVYHPVSPEVAGQIMRVKELVAVSEVDRALTNSEARDLRKPDPGYYVESAVPR